MEESGVISHDVERHGPPVEEPNERPSEGAGQIAAAESAVVAPARSIGPQYFTGSYHHAVDAKNRLVLPADFRVGLGEGGRLGPLDGCLGLWPEGTFAAVLDRWEDGVDLGMVSEEVRDEFLASTYWVHPDGQGRIVVHKDLRAFAGIAGPVTILGSRQGINVWAADRWRHRQSGIPEGRDAALRQAVRDLRI